MDAWSYLGFFAGALTSTGALPQIIKGYKTKRMHDVSLLMGAILCTGMALWLIYGFVREDIAIIAANIAGTVFTGILVAMKIHYDRTALAH